MLSSSHGTDRYLSISFLAICNGELVVLEPSATSALLLINRSRRLGFFFSGSLSFLVEVYGVQLHCCPPCSEVINQ